MNRLTRVVYLFLVSFIFLLIVTPVWAQRTGDHIVPSIETVCDGDPFSFGLCNAYCEALDCDSDTPLGTPRACANKLKNYLKKSDGSLPPCEIVSCPCNFDAAADFASLLALAEAEDGIVVTDEDLDATMTMYCANLGPNDEVAFITQADDGDSGAPQIVRLYYWVTGGDDENIASCNGAGGGLDGERDEPNLSIGAWTYGPYLSRMEGLSESDVENCRSVLDSLCP